MSDPLLTYVLRQGDRALVLAQRLLEAFLVRPTIAADDPEARLQVEFFLIHNGWYNKRFS